MSMLLCIDFDVIEHGNPFSGQASGGAEEAAAAEAALLANIAAEEVRSSLPAHNQYMSHNPQ